MAEKAADNRQGKIIRGVGGFYYVHTGAGGVYECRAKGIFRREKIRPLVGDDVELEILDGEAKEGNIRKILPRKNTLLRPAVANIDQALMLFALVRPEPNWNLLDRFLIMMGRRSLPCVVCFNKSDIATGEEIKKIKSAYGACGCRVLFISAKKREGVSQVRSLLQGKTTAMAGPSGVGKSSLLNCLCPEAAMEVGELSRKIGRGKHTTRHSELFALDQETYLMDTPGFSSLQLFGVEQEELKDFYPEFWPYEAACRFRGCAHIGETDCGVKAALAEGKISAIRYRNYAALYEELKEQKKYER